MRCREQYAGRRADTSGDGLRAEREQGITIDVAYRYFATPKRSFILADTPGYVQYTRNTVYGASTAQLTVLLVDARKGVLAQTRRHAAVLALLVVPRLVLAVNKIDLVADAAIAFTGIAREFGELARRLGWPAERVQAIPVSAAMIAAADDIPDRLSTFEATVCWLDETPPRPGARVLLKHGTSTTDAVVRAVTERFDEQELCAQENPISLGLNDIGCITIRVATPLMTEHYTVDRGTGSFLLIDPVMGNTLAAGLIGDVLGAVEIGADSSPAGAR